MRAIRHSITTAPLACELTSFHFGTPGVGPKVYIQAALHADEIPGMLVARELRRQLETLEAEGRVRGEIVLVPVANPLGLSQSIQGTPFGRFDLSTGANFNRAFRHVAAELKQGLDGLLGPDPQVNIALVRAQALAAVALWQPRSDGDVLKKTLLGLAIDADIVLDLHCDNEAVLHLYTGTPLAQRLAPLAALLDAHAVLVALEAGEEPFDEACSRLWWDLAAHFGPELPLPPACAAATIELRGEMDVNYGLAERDAQALLAFLACEGVLELPRSPRSRRRAVFRHRSRRSKRSWRRMPAWWCSCANWATRSRRASRLPTWSIRSAAWQRPCWLSTAACFLPVPHTATCFAE